MEKAKIHHKTMEEAIEIYNRGEELRNSPEYSIASFREVAERMSMSYMMFRGLRARVKKYLKAGGNSGKKD